MVVLAFLVPVALVITPLARDRAIAAAESQAAALKAVLAITTDPAAVAKAVAAGESPERVALYGLPPKTLGQGRAAPNDLAAVGDEPSVVDVEGGAVYLEPVRIGEKGRGVVEVFVPEAELTRGVDDTWWALIGIAFLLLLVSVLASDRLASRVVRSARGLAAAARTVGDGDLSARVPTAGPRELSEAAAAFNAMADRIATMRAAERELIADLSHRLRTPLTALRLEADHIRTGGPERFGQAIEAMEREVDHLIRTARRPVDVREPEPGFCDAASVVRERMGFWSAVADDQSRPYWVLGSERRAPVGIPRSELGAALDALLGNVFRYTPQGTAFEVAVSRRDGYVAVRVDDAGPGIDNPHRAVRRGTSDRGSTGLGLDIVRRAAEAGHGTVNIARASLGGTSIVMLLADADPPVTPGRPLWGFVGRLSREPGERRWGRRARAASNAWPSL
jgi:signal transduction histidine kinase